MDKLSETLELCSTIHDNLNANNDDDNGADRDYLTTLIMTRETSFIGLVTLHAAPTDVLMVLSQWSKVGLSLTVTEGGGTAEMIYPALRTSLKRGKWQSMTQTVVRLW